MSRECTLVAAAPYVTASAYNSVIAEAECLIAVDGGVDLCRALGRVPDVVIGDLDSATLEGIGWAEASSAKIVRVSTEKDFSDLDAALKYAADMGSSRVTVTAAFSGRLDHSLACVGSLFRYAHLCPRISEPGFQGWILAPSGLSTLSLSMIGQTVSIVTAIGEATVSLEGFRYPLSRGAIDPLSSFAISNVVERFDSRITVHSGVILVMLMSLTDI